MLLRQSFRQAPRAMGIFSPGRSAPSKRTLTTTPIRLDSSPQQPSSYREGMARYKTFTRPFGKVFLGAVLVYQVIYWSWLKLEMDESKLEKNEEMSALEKKARELAGSKK
ncbi:hypothetical protein N7448_008245 [Penicillium atrosanguineum]|uniref:Uncharacterized protein n=1 Tax=Penicillium atrosanguineum TaxID=1132637 RepID=A0A9W9GR80_9EURO|nr:amino acid permease-domain-containing protein [Penicillium atrosanguineum]KAJ5127466.1 hypothetical protein N7448_008245 [Penicillium atrosanguineum]KAJ5147670.1 hypothetical protein N7526_001022 [Penicillium atrosanguineum]KAJ5313857.1 amino acid permease-domain-containing protein [Penicillium atrosanguineum]KAJ5331028.1 hypothetical protein N7476_000811 [Penicillium atrosanguineum]